jgi:polysaccharide biosynthesis protein PslH
VKMLEALRRGKPVVTTTIGAGGLGDDAADAIVIADDPDEFAAAVVRLLEEPRQRRALGRAARRFAKTLPTWDEAADALVAAYAKLTPTYAGTPRAAPSSDREEIPSLR